MKRYLFDTNVWIKALKGIDLILLDRFTATPPEQAASCATVRAELMHGARKYGNPIRRQERVEGLLNQFASLPFDDRAADVYGRVRDELERDGIVIGALDLQIAAIALAHDLTVVTSSVGEFRRVHGLQVEDWSAAVA